MEVVYTIFVIAMWIVVLSVALALVLRWYSDFWTTVSLKVAVGFASLTVVALGSIFFFAG